MKHFTPIVRSLYYNFIFDGKYNIIRVDFFEPVNLGDRK